MKKNVVNLLQIPGTLRKVSFACFFFVAIGSAGIISAANMTMEGDGIMEKLQDGKQIAVKGKILDETGEPLIGVTVKVRGSTLGTITDMDGNFSLTVPASTSVLELTYMGYLPQQITVGNKTYFDITMEVDSKVLDAVIVTAPIGVQRPPREIGYSVSSISAKQLTESGTTNFGSALYGKAAGVKITTAPGGATSAVNIQIRGVNSLNYNQQPLYVVDGVMVRNDGQNGGAGANNDGYWGDQRIRGNGMLDINPMDIESMTILKGASASALYGSDASSGVIVITTKKGSRDPGLGVELTYNGVMENVAFLPKYQTVYGPGYGPDTNLANGATVDGWINDPNSKFNGGYRPYFRAYAQFGPKYDGSVVSWWDGTTGTYDAKGKNNYADLFQTGFTSNLNLALSKQTDAVNYRLSYTRLDNTGIQRGSNLEKNTFNLNTVVNLNKNISLDVVANYINTNTHNRATSTNRLLANFGGMFSRAENVSTFLDRYQTSKGFKYVSLENANRNPSEAFIYNIRAYDVLDYFWDRLRNEYDETENRLITSATLNWAITGKLKFRGRIGNDFTAMNIEDKRYNDYPVAFNSGGSTGMYSVQKNQYSIIYGDAMLTYSDKITPDFGLTVAGGFQGRQEEYKQQYSSTGNGLNVENWFTLSNSYGVRDATSRTQELLKYAYLGVVNLAYKDMLFLEGTARQEYASSLPPANNHYFYTSTNASWIYSEAFKMPSWMTYGKLRASYGVVGNAPPMYEANIAFTQQPLQTVRGSIPSFVMNNKFGNMDLKAEMKHEWEFGLEKRFWDDRLSLDVSFYTNKVKGQIMNIAVPLSSGAASQTVNVGEIGNNGLEVALSVMPLTGKLKWTSRFNFGFNSAKVNSLKEGISEIQFWSEDEGSIKISAVAGETLGNIYSYVRKTNDKGEFLINNNGYYVIDQSRYEKVGNIMPKVVGGWSNSFNYKNFLLDFTIDYRFGGQIVSPQSKYNTSAGMYKSTMPYRDADNGGLPWVYTDTKGNSYNRNDGVIVSGVNENTGNPNTKVVAAADYYSNTFGWGATGWNDAMVHDNNFIKFREVTVGYRVPDAFAKKMALSGLRFTLYGRNLFYVWRSLENIDPEAPIGNRWWSQGVDDGASPAARSVGFSINAKF